MKNHKNSKKIPSMSECAIIICRASVVLAVGILAVTECVLPSECVAAEDTFAATTKIKLQGFQGYSGTHNWGSYSAPFTLANLDKDPELEVLVKEWRDWSYMGHGQYKHKNTVPAKLYAYDHDGSPLWEYFHGYGVNVGCNFAPVIAYDMDGDGICEIFTRKADDTKQQWPDTVLTETGHDWIVRLDPATGEEQYRAPWPAHHGYPGYNQLFIGYLDGEQPFVIAKGGHYGTSWGDEQSITAYDKDLRIHWSKDWRGYSGSHTPFCADIDDDGKDEVVLGGRVLDHDGYLLWTKGSDTGHVDLVVAADIDWKNPGLEILFGSQDTYFTGVVRGRDGSVLWSKKQKVHSQEGCGEFDTFIEGLECFGWQDNKDGYNETEMLMWDAVGNELSASEYFPRMGGKDRNIYLWWRGAEEMDVLGDPGVPQPKFIRMVGDIKGDWREELAWIYRNEITICTPSGSPVLHRPSLREDRKYRAELARGSFYFSETHYSRPLPGGRLFDSEGNPILQDSEVTTYDYSDVSGNGKS